MLSTSFVLIARLRVAVAVCCGVPESFTVMLTVLGPLAVGVPLIVPVPASMLRPAGNPVADHVYGETPPVAATGALYVCPVMPLASVVVVMLSLGIIVIVNVLVAVKAVGLVESVTVT